MVLSPNPASIAAIPTCVTEKLTVSPPGILCDDKKMSGLLESRLRHLLPAQSSVFCFYCDHLFCGRSRKEAGVHLCVWGVERFLQDVPASVSAFLFPDIGMFIVQIEAGQSRLDQTESHTHTVCRYSCSRYVNLSVKLCLLLGRVSVRFTTCALTALTSNIRPRQLTREYMQVVHSDL